MLPIFSSFVNEPRNFSFQNSAKAMINLFLYVHFIIIILTDVSNGFNIKPQADHIAFINRGSLRSSYFGYSVGILKTQSNAWLLAGAPRANSSVPNIVEPGSLFKCDLNNRQKPCVEVVLDQSSNFDKRGMLGVSPLRNHAWTGAALDIDKKGNVIVGAPRWSDASKSHLQEYNTNGICYLLGSDLTSNTAEFLHVLLSPGRQLYNYYGRGVYYYQHGQVGMAVHVTNSEKQQVLLGAPGLLNWQGSVAWLDAATIPTGNRKKRHATTIYNTRVIPNPIYTSKIQDGNYFGYSVTSGKFDMERNYHYVAGAPRGSNTYGMALVFRIRDTETDPLVIKEERIGLQLGEYFGASVAAPDLNGDKLSDLVVGAPLHSLQGIGDAGCVYVYMNNIIDGKLSVHGIQLFGDSLKGARFGTALGTPGDLNNDGFEDLLVGAPYENVDEGAVYVYMGYRNGIRKLFTQKLTPNSVTRQFPLRGFGISFSRPVDLDDNKYPDFAVGSFLSDAVAIMVTRPVITVKGKISSTPSKLLLSHTFFTVTPCVSYEGYSVPPSADFTVTIALSQESGDGTIPATFRDNGNPDIQIPLKSTIGRNPACRELPVDLPQQRKNFLLPIIIQMTYDLVSDGSTGPVVDPYAIRSESMTLSFSNECKNDICHTDLMAKAHFPDYLSGNPLLVGEAKKITMIVEVTNLNDPAFLPKVMISYPSTMKLFPSIHVCNSQPGNFRLSFLSCSLNSILLKNELEKLTFEFDATTLDDSSSDIAIGVHASSAADFEDNESNNNVTVQLKLKKKAVLEFVGSSNPEQFSYQKFDDRKIESNETIEMKHIIMINKKDVTPLGSVLITAMFPSEINITGKHVKVLEDFKNELAFHSKSYTCEERNSKSAKEYSSIQRFYELSCEDEYFNCKTVVCEIGPWETSFDFAVLTVSFKLNLTALSEVIYTRKGAVLKSYVYADIVSLKGVEEQFEGTRNIKGTIETKLIAGTPPADPLAWWIYFLAILGGLILLALIAYGLFKAGFFKRKKKLMMESQKATLIHQEENQQVST